MVCRGPYWHTFGGIGPRAKALGPILPKVCQYGPLAYHSRVITYKYLVKHLMNAQYSADDALQDVCSLQKLITYSHVTIDMMCKYNISIECALDNYMYEQGDVIFHTLNNTLQ